MIHCKDDYIIENDQLLLRPLLSTDFNELLEFSMNEPEIWKYNAFGADGAENLKKYIDNAIFQREQGAEYPFAVIKKSENKIIGSTRFYAISTINKTLELGYTWYGKQYQGTFVNKTCKFLLLEFAFEKMGFERVGFKANSGNERSINAMKSIGCVVEGTLRNFAFDSQLNRIDVAVLSIVREEWLNIVKQNLQQKINTF
ncbi:GNAT family N-acetyltransferase [Chryseobacterium sp. c4a]|uniref:GNAT family N-acetyltransferase n=1 Tax=Chryseobacterium sp. c4a TaxID=1573582 RepID=UPI00135993C4|nr:GNAT family N-acetyltransferase [Chryseobacterium sp. c4a]